MQVTTSLPTLFDFYTTWCQPCKIIAPYLDQLSTELFGRIKIVKVNVDNNIHVTKQYNIITVPTLILFKNGQEIKRRVGGGSKLDIYNFIKDSL